MASPFGFLRDYGEYVGRSGARMVEDWAGVFAEGVTRPDEAIQAINPWNPENDELAASILAAGQQRAEQVGPWLSGEMSQGAQDIGMSVENTIGETVRDIDMLQTALGTLEDPSLQLALELLPVAGGVLARGTRAVRKSADLAGELEKAFVRRNPGYALDADPALPGPNIIGRQMGGTQRGAIGSDLAGTRAKGLDEWKTEIDTDGYPGQTRPEIYSFVSHPQTGEQVGQMSAFKTDEGGWRMDETAEIYDEYQGQGAGTAALERLVDEVGTLERSTSEAPGMVALMNKLSKKGYELTDDAISAPTSITTPTGYQKPAVPGEAIRLGPRNRKAVPETLKTEFTSRGDDFWGVKYDDELGGSAFDHSGYSGVQCTGFACAVKHKLEPGRAEVFGFDAKSNPTAGSNDLADGHDFAVVDNRYIVDPWLSEVESGRITTHKGEKLDVGNQVVFDMKKDQDLIKKIYGDQEAWKKMQVPERPFFDESLYRAMAKPDPEYAKARKSDAPLPERATDYPQTLWPELAWDEKKLKYYASKAESPEGAKLLKARAKAQKDMDKNGYTPYFDISERYNVDPKNYTRRADTQTEERYTRQDVEKVHQAAIKTPEARQRMDEAYTEAEGYSGAHDWYAMGQLEAEFVKELGPKAGRKAFRDKFSDAMATTTGGSSPKDNFTNAMYGNYLANRGLTPPAAAFDMPSPIGGRYISGNMQLYDEVARGRILDALMPKRHNFSSNFEGFMDRSTIDEQMTELATPGKKSPEGKTYGIYEELVDEMAQTKGVMPANYQDVAWAGTKLKAEAKKARKSSYVPQPMIETVNEAIERTSRISGQSPEEVLKYGIIRGETPVYSHPAAAIGAAIAGKGLEQALLLDDET